MTGTTGTERQVPARARRRWWVPVPLQLLVLVGVALVGVALAVFALRPGPSTFTGRWEAAGYTCPFNVQRAEVIDVVQNDQELVGTKVVGDDCVPAGARTFQGQLDGTSARVDLWAASPGQKPAISYRGLPLTIVDADHFTMDQVPGQPMLRFTRAAAPRSIPWWLLAVGAIVLAVGAFLLRARTRPSV